MRLSSIGHINPQKVSYATRDSNLLASYIHITLVKPLVDRVRSEVLNLGVISFLLFSLQYYAYPYLKDHDSITGDILVLELMHFVVFYAMITCACPASN